MVLNSLAPSSMHMVQEKNDIIDIEREKCIIKKGMVRKETERQDNSSFMEAIQKKLNMIDIERKMYNNERN